MEKIPPKYSDVHAMLATRTIAAPYYDSHAASVTNPQHYGSSPVIEPI